MSLAWRPASAEHLACKFAHRRPPRAPTRAAPAPVEPEKRISDQYREIVSRSALPALYSYVAIVSWS